MKSSLQLVSRILQRKSHRDDIPEPSWQTSTKSCTSVDAALTSFDGHPALVELRMLTTAAERFGIGNPFFKMHEGAGGSVTQINGKEYLNFSHYNYLGLNGHPEVNKAVKEAVERYGTSAGASRLVAGERPVQRALEKALADVYGVDDCVVFVSGHATNVSTISTLFGPGDLILHDSLIHNSVLEGIRLSRAARRPFPHNDLNALDTLLAASRTQYKRIMLREPERVQRLRERGALFLDLARREGLDVGTSHGLAIIPIIVGSSRKAIALSNRLFDQCINVQPIIHPAVEEKSARLRFFLSTMHSESDIRHVCRTLARLVHGKDITDD